MGSCERATPKLLQHDSQVQQEVLHPCVSQEPPYPPLPKKDNTTFSPDCARSRTLQTINETQHAGHVKPRENVNPTFTRQRNDIQA